MINQRNQIYLWGAICCSLLLFPIFKSIYPYPQIIFDSYNYIEAAQLNWDFNAWPIGYSKFLQFFGFFSHSALALVCFQYLFLQSSFIFFFFTWVYFFNPGKYVKFILFLALFVNPLYIYCSNLILSDALFVGLSICWITQLLWIICRPKPYMIFSHSIIIIVAFTIRYNALYYPIVSALAFLLSKQNVLRKIIGIALPCVLFGLFIGYTGNQIAKVTGRREFSPFAGWKLANDAIYVYAHVPAEKRQQVPEKFKALDKKIQQHFSTTKNKADFLEDDFSYGSFYMFYQESPLVLYMDSLYGSGFPFLNTKKWLTVAPLSELRHLPNMQVSDILCEVFSLA
jgi:hypothetical protein